jgi:hypothetical protein
LNGKQSIRYTGFECTNNGGRRFDFSIAMADRITTVYSVDVAGPSFSGPDRILVQEAAGICFLKVKEMIGEMIGGGSDVTANRISLSSTDIAQYRQAVPIQGRLKKKLAAIGTT